MVDLAKTNLAACPPQLSALDAFNYELRLKNAAIAYSLLHRRGQEPDVEVVEVLHRYVQGDYLSRRQTELFQQRLRATLHRSPPIGGKATSQRHSKGNAAPLEPEQQQP